MGRHSLWAQSASTRQSGRLVAPVAISRATSISRESERGPGPWERRRGPGRRTRTGPTRAMSLPRPPSARSAGHGQPGWPPRPAGVPGAAHCAWSISAWVPSQNRRRADHASLAWSQCLPGLSRSDPPPQVQQALGVNAGPATCPEGPVAAADSRCAARSPGSTVRSGRRCAERLASGDHERIQVRRVAHRADAVYPRSHQSATAAVVVQPRSGPLGQPPQRRARAAAARAMASPSSSAPPELGARGSRRGPWPGSRHVQRGDPGGDPAPPVGQGVRRAVASASSQRPVAH